MSAERRPLVPPTHVGPRQRIPSFLRVTTLADGSGRVLIDREDLVHWLRRDADRYGHPETRNIVNDIIGKLDRLGRPT